jgi:hypothetical protein
MTIIIVYAFVLRDDIISTERLPVLSSAKVLFCVMESEVPTVSFHLTKI